MKLPCNKLLLSVVIANLVSLPTYAAYSFKIPLDVDIIQFIGDSDIEGTVNIDKNSMIYGENAKISWNYEKLSSISIEGLGTYNTRSGSINVSPKSSTVFNIRLTNGKKTKEEQLLLDVIVPEPDVVFKSSRTGMQLGQSVTLTWDVKNSESVNIDIIQGSGYVFARDLPSSGSQVITAGGNVIGSTLIYKLTAKGYEGVADKTSLISLDIVGNPAVNSFTRTPSTRSPDNYYRVGDTLNLKWDVLNLETLYINSQDDTGLVTKLPMNNKSTGTNIVLTKEGLFNYSLIGYGYNGYTTPYPPTTNFRVYAPALIRSFTVNGGTNITAKLNDTLQFAWDSTTPLSNFNLYPSNGGSYGYFYTSRSSNIKVTTLGLRTYQLEINNGDGDVAYKVVTVNVIN